LRRHKPADSPTRPPKTNPACPRRQTRSG
jgi:hypothetical protein